MNIFIKPIKFTETETNDMRIGVKLQEKDIPQAWLF